MGILQKEHIDSEVWHESRKANTIHGPIHSFFNLLEDIDEELEKCESCLQSSPLGGFGYSSQKNQIEKLKLNTGKLINFKEDFPADLDTYVDYPFYVKVHNDVLDFLATIDVSKITTPNTLGLKHQTNIYAMGYNQEALGLAKTLDIHHFVGEGGMNSSLNKKQYVDDFLIPFKMHYNEFMRTNTDEQYKDFSLSDFRNHILPREFAVEKEVGFWLKLLDSLADLTIVIPLIEAATGIDIITGDHLTASESNMRVLSATINIITTCSGTYGAWKFAGGSLKHFGKAMLGGLVSDIASTSTFSITQEMDAPPAVSTVFSIFVGFKTGKAYNKFAFKGPTFDQVSVDTLMKDFKPDVKKLSENYNIREDDIEELLLKPFNKLTSREAQFVDQVINEYLQTAVMAKPAIYEVPTHVQSILDEYNLDADAFNKINSKKIKTQKEINLLKEIRDKIPALDETTAMRKIIPTYYVDGIINDPDYANPTGFMTGQEYVKDISDISDVIESSRLDYTNNPYVKTGNYAYIDFSSKDIDILYTPHNPNFGGNVTTQTWPFTGTGFTSGRNLTIVPEWITPEKVGLAPQVGSTIHEVIDGKDVIVAIYKDNLLTKKGYWKDLR